MNELEIGGMNISSSGHNVLKIK